MKGLNNSLLAKVIAMFLLVISFVIGSGCVCGFSYIYSNGLYGDNDYFSTSYFYRIAQRDAIYIADLAYNGYSAEEIDRQIKIDKADYTYEVYLDEVIKYIPEEDVVNQEIIDNGETMLWGDTYYYLVSVETTDTDVVKNGGTFGEDDVAATYEYYNEYYHDEPNSYEQKEIYAVRLNYRIPVNDGPLKESYDFYNAAFALRYWIVIIGILMAVIFIADFIFLMCAAGHRPGTDEIVPNWQDKVPLDIYVAAVTVLVVLDILVMAFFVDQIYYRAYLGNAITILGFGLSLVILIVLCLASLMTLATRLKMGKFWQNTIIYMFFDKILGGFAGFLGNFGLVGKWMIIAAVLLFGNLVGIFAFPVLIIIDIIALRWLYKFIINMKTVKDGAERMAGGNLEEKIDTANLKGDLKDHADNLNSIGVGMSLAVEQRMKSERFKTELITNVSHDIKTPLTSIINYVDLIRKEEPEGKIDEYSEVLEKQANRLKKLLEDLLEASKASTGNLPVSFEKMDVCEIINQAVGEYSEKLEEKELEAVVAIPDVPTYIMADGRKLWRIFDNLLNNIYKYAQPKTRAYIEAAVKGEKVVISFKNISKDRLNIASDELMERFVRGDSSRNTEGSGLGLNIAKSFAELQKGKFEISVDGDLFKVEVTFDRVNE